MGTWPPSFFTSFTTETGFFLHEEIDWKGFQGLKKALITSEFE